MNKGLFYHILASIAYVIAVFYIINGENVEVFFRIIIVIGLIFTNAITFTFLNSSNAYKEKI